MTYKFQPYGLKETIRDHLNMGGETALERDDIEAPIFKRDRSIPFGGRIRVNSDYIERCGVPWIGVMGEYHFARDSRENWHTELCKIKAGGVNVVSTYVFWIYHEEVEGEFDFTGDRDLKAFLRLTRQVGLDVVLRIGPWAHGECRNGGLPDWLLQKPYKLRDNNPEYMEKVRIWYSKIYEQARGMFYKNANNIIGIQLENELVDNAEHIAALKELAQEIGFDVPIWTATGWNSLYGARLPVKEVLPVFGAYPEAPWAETIDPLPLSPHYVFNTERNDTAIGTDLIKPTDKDGWRLPTELYPFATCEIGGGMQPTHHRRPVITPQDIYSLALCKLGDGCNLLGYYMYKGGTNKIGRLSTLNETKATGYPNDYTALSYDFQAPISEFGEIREHYRLLNMLHMFVRDFGYALAPLQTVLSEKTVDENDLISLRYAMRTNGRTGFVFVNHYQRLAKLKDNKDVVIDTGDITFPPIDITGDISFIMPFNLAFEIKQLEFATAQLLCRVRETMFFAAIPGIPARIRFTDGTDFTAKPSKDSPVFLDYANVVVLSWDEARFTRKFGEDVYIGEKCDLYVQDGEIRCVGGGSFTYYKWDDRRFRKHTVEAEREPEQARLLMTDCDAPFEPTERYELEIGGKRALTRKKLEVTSADGFVSINEKYDCAQIYIDGVLAADNFCLGKPWRVPAKLLFGKECYLVMSELRDDFYHEGDF